MRLASMLTLVVAVLPGCGYRVGTRADLLPDSLRTIAIPAFGNNTTRYKLTERLPYAIAKELAGRTRYRVVADPNDADAILQGNVSNFIAAPTIFDSATGRAAGVQIIVVLDLKLVERSTGKLLYNRPSYEARGRYEVSTDERQYFDESEAGLERVCGDVARNVVSSILEAF